MKDGRLCDTEAIDVLGMVEGAGGELCLRRMRMRRGRERSMLEEVDV